MEGDKPAPIRHGYIAPAPGATYSCYPNNPQNKKPQIIRLEAFNLR